MAGSEDRSSRPHHCLHWLVSELEQRVLQLRRDCRKGPIWIGRQLDLPASTVGRVLRRHRVPLLSHLDPTTGVLIRGRRASAERYELPEPGALVHIDVKELGKIPPRGGWRVHGGCLARALTHSAARGVAVREVMTDDAFAYRHAHAWKQVLADRGVEQVFIKPHCPWTGKVERFNRTLQTEWVHRQQFLADQQRRDALPEWLEFYNTRRSHTALGHQPPNSRLGVHNLSGAHS